MTLREDLGSLQEKLAFRAEQGKVELEGARVLIVSASALGTLRRDLISVLGCERAKGFLLRYGFECGYSDARAVRRRHGATSHQFWTEQAALLHTLEGVARVRIEKREFDRARGHYVVHGVWENSYEAEEHIRLLGISDDASCWTLIGYAGGYLTAVMGRRVLYKEIRCVARGDPECRFIGKTVDLWGEEAQAELAFYTESKIAEELDEAHRRIQQQHQLLTQMTLMHDQLTRIVLEGRGRQALTEAVGRMLATPVAVEDRYLRPLAAWSPPDTLEPSSCFLGSLAEEDPSLRERLRALTSERRTVELGPDVHPALSARYVAPIRLGSDLMGYVSLIRQPHENPELVRMFIERAAAALGLELLKERIVIETESRLKGELIEDLLSGSTSVEILRDRARHMGHDLDRPHRFLLLRIDPSPHDPAGNEERAFLLDELCRLVRSELRRGSGNVHVANRRDELLLLFASGPGGQRADRLVPLVRDHARKVLRATSFSLCVSREARSLEQLRPAFEECRAILNLQHKFGRKGRVLQADDVRAFDLLYAGIGEDALLSYARRSLRELLAYDEEHDSHLVPTLYWFLALEGNLKKTAEALNLSLSGLKYRLQRLQDLVPFDLGDPDVRFDLQIALRALALAEAAGKG